MRYNYIAIEGNIGSGKTSLAKKLSSDIGASLILEKFEDNPFLPKFYEDSQKNAFPLELFFLAERYHQIKENNQDLFGSCILSDYFFIKSKFFANNNLKDDELQLFNRLFDIMVSSLPKPDFVIYLYASVSRLKENIKKRGRVFEQAIKDEYLQNIQSRYLDFFRKQRDFPVLVVDVSYVDFLLDEQSYLNIKKELYIDRQNGFYHKVLSPNDAEVDQA